MKSALWSSCWSCGLRKTRSREIFLCRSARGAQRGIDFEFELMALRALAEEIRVWHELGGADAFADEAVEAAFDAFTPWSCTGRPRRRCGQRRGSVFRPAFEIGHVDEASADAVGEVVERVGGVVRPVHDLAFDALEAVALVPGVSSMGKAWPPRAKSSHFS
jgi:hypothetical protein